MKKLILLLLLASIGLPAVAQTYRETRVSYYYDVEITCLRDMDDKEAEAMFFISGSSSLYSSDIKRKLISGPFSASEMRNYLFSMNTIFDIHPEEPIVGQVVSGDYFRRVRAPMGRGFNLEVYTRENVDEYFDLNKNGAAGLLAGFTRFCTTQAIAYD